MTPSARIEAAIELWEKIWAAGVPMDSICGDYFRVRRYIGSKDRASIVERSYAMMRHYGRVSWWLNRINADDTPRNRVLADLALRDGLPRVHISDLFTGAKHAPEALDDSGFNVLDKLCDQTMDHPDMDDATRYECPAEMAERLRSIWGDDFNAELEAMLHTATLDLRINVVKTDRDMAHDALDKQGVQSEKTPYSPLGLRVKGKVHLSGAKAFVKGLVDIQDEGSQLIALLCGAKPGMQVIDACAGAGGKTLALAGIMENKGRIVAMDIDGRRLNRGKPRYKRADIHNVETRPLDDDKHRKWLRRQKENFDIVLVDAPCSSTGTWRRNPDYRWRNHGPSLDEIKVMQSDILDRFAKCIKPGGKMVYATCSLLAEENEDQVARFLNDHPDFKLMPLTEAWADTGLDTPCPPGTDMMRLTPRQSNTDGFFAAVMQREGAPDTSENQ